MRRIPITTADEYARQAQQARDKRDHRWAECVRVDPSIWDEILDRYPELAGDTVENLNLPDEIAVRLARWPLAYVRQRLARHERLPRRAIKSLKLDVCDGVRDFLVSNASLTEQDLIELMESDERHAVGEPYMVDDAPYYLKIRFAIDWRGHIDSPRPKRRSPYEDPARMAEVLQEAGYSNLDPLNPLPGRGWPEACEAFDDACVWLAYGGFTSDELFEELASAEGWESPEAAALSPFCPPRILAALSYDWDSVVRRAVASNRQTDLPTLVYLASDDDFEARGAARVALDQRFGVRLAKSQVVARPDPDSLPLVSSAGQFNVLCRSADPVERATAVWGRLTPDLFPDLINLKFDHRDLFANQSIPIETLRSLASNAQTLLNIKPETIWWPQSLLGRPELALAIAHHPDLEVREWALRSANTTEHALLLLAKPDRIDLDLDAPDDDLADSARWHLNRHFGHKFPKRSRSIPSPRTQSANQFIELCRSDDPLDREKATTQKAAYPGLWREVLERAPELAKWVAINETVGPRLLDQLANWPDPEVRKWVSDHPRVWLKTLNRLAVDADPAVRRRAVYNARLSNHMLGRLRHDSDPEVASEATRRLAARAYVDRLLNDPEWWRHLGNSEIE